MQTDAAVRRLTTGVLPGPGFGSLAGVCLLSLCLIGSSNGAQNEGSGEQIVPRPTSVRPPFEAAANALGMERGVRRELTAINAIYFSGKGTMSVPADGGAPVERKLTNAVISMSYHLPAIRSDLTWRGADGKPQRQIQVANGKLAWNETEPGIGATATTDSATQRLRAVWLTPHGAMRAMVDARAKNPDAVKISSDGGRTTFSMDFQGGPLEVVVDASHRPERVRWSVGGSTTDTQFSRYKDWEILDVYFPQRIVQQVDGRTVMDLTVTEFRSNPYVVFPVPAVARERPQ